MESIDNAYTSTSQDGLDLVLGLGLSGFSCARFLARQGREFRVADSRLAPPFAQDLQQLLPLADVEFGEFDEAILEGVSRLVVSPGIPSSSPIIQLAMQRNVPVISDIELFAQVAPAPVIAITGSNGKSTVTTWVSHVLGSAGFECSTGGNLGTPALDLLDEAIPDFYVLELSSFQLERTSNLHLKVGAILNIGTDHIDHHGDIESYRAAKWRLMRHCETAVLYAPLLSTPGYAREVDKSFTKTVGYGETAGEGIEYHLLPATQTDAEYVDASSEWLCQNGKKLLPASVLKVVGHHNSLNALAVLAIAQSCGVSWSAAIDGLTSFAGLPHRMQWIGESRGVTWINDSKGTNADATIAAIGSVASPLVLIAGGDGKGADFAPLAKVINAPSSAVRVVILIGADAQAIFDAIKQGKQRAECEVVFVQLMDEAVIIAADRAQPGDTVMLSPACASFDMFDNYMQRGDAFVQAWRSLA